MAKKVDKTTEYVNILRRADIFYDLTEPQLEMVATICSELAPKAGEIVFEENSASNELYVVAKGEIGILVSPALVQAAPTGKSSRPLNIVTLGRGQTFGEIALVDQGVRSAAAHCASRKTQLLVIPRDQLIKLCDDHPDLGYRLMHNIAADLAFKIRGTDMMVREQLLWGQRQK